MTNTELSKKKCVPCKGGVPPMEPSEIKEFLSKVNSDWVVDDKGRLFRELKFNNFANAMEFANKIGKIADEEDHHPDLYIAWGKCAVEIWTHKINGLSESDFILAAKIDDIKLII